MADKAVVEKWLRQLTRLPTAPGREEAVVAWVRAWVARRPDLTATTDSGGNLLVTQKGRHRHPTVLAVAHMDHPAFVIGEVGPRGIRFEFRGGVDPVYFDDAMVEVVSRPRGPRALRVVSYDPGDQVGTFQREGEDGDIESGDIAMWRFGRARHRAGMLQAPACDDLAGVAAALAALDLARHDPKTSHYGVLLTRAEEVGLIGAIHAARHRTVPEGAVIISIETSRELPNAPIGGGPIIRTGDRSTVFDRELTNRISDAAAVAGLRHQRRLMDGGGCEATAFGAYGYRSTGLCVALRNWHNRGNLDGVEAGTAKAVAMMEEISLADFHGLVDLILLSASAVLDESDDLVTRLEALYRSKGAILG
jgi:endoglucanase